MSSLAYKMNVISNKTHDELFQKGNNTYQLFEPGMCFLLPWVFSPLYLTDKDYIEDYSKRYFEKLLSFDYWVNWRKRRPPVAVVLPNKQVWCLDERLDDVDRDVSGVFPFVSVDKPLKTEKCVAYVSKGMLLIDEIKQPKTSQFLSTLQVF